MAMLPEKPMFSRRALITFSIPVILDALLSIVAGLVDTAMVSSAGPAVVSGVSLVDSFALLFVSAFSALSLGGTVVTAQYIGNQNYEKAKTSAKQLIYSVVIISVAVSAILLCCYQNLLHILYPKIEADVFESAKAYFFFTLFGYPFFALGNACTSLLRSMGKSRPAFIIPLISNITNVIGNAILIFGFDMGAAGAAISTTLSRVLWASLGLWILHSKDLPAYLEDLLHIRFDWGILRKVLSIASANALESGLFQCGKILVSRLISTFGTISIAAFTVFNSICGLGWYTISAIGTVSLTVVGQCMGAGKPDQAKHYAKRLIQVGFLISLVLFGGIYLLRNQLVGLFSFTGEAKTASAYYTGLGALLTIASIYALSFVPNNAFRAAGDTRFSVVLATVSMFTFRVGLSYVLGGWLQMGLTGVLIGMWADWFCRSICNAIHFVRGKWLTKKVI